MYQEEKVKEILTKEENDNDKKMPESIATGTAQIEILNHGLVNKKIGGEEYGKVLKLSFKNIADASIGLAIFEVKFYNSEGIVLDTVDYSVADIEKGRVISINMGPNEAVYSDIMGYNVRAVKVVMTPIPVVTGDEKIKIMNHSLRETDFTNQHLINSGVIDLAIRNVSDKTIASVIYEAIYYDSEGNVLDIVIHKDYDIKPKRSRAISIVSDKVKNYDIKSYKVTLLKSITTDIEKVQLCGSELRTLENGCEEVCGIVKNISDVKIDAALLVGFKDNKNINIGTRVVVMKDLEPGMVRRFNFIFDTPKEEKVKSCSFDIGEIVETN